MLTENNVPTHKDFFVAMDSYDKQDLLALAANNIQDQIRRSHVQP